MSDVYHSPEDYGLELLAEYDLRQESYEFDIRAVWRQLDGPDAGILYTAQDSGCSCPSPFEIYNSVESLERLTSMDMLKEEYRERVASGYSSLDQAGWESFKTKVEAALDDLAASSRKPNKKVRK